MSPSLFATFQIVELRENPFLCRVCGQLQPLGADWAIHLCRNQAFLIVIPAMMAELRYRGLVREIQ